MKKILFTVLGALLLGSCAESYTRYDLDEMVNAPKAIVFGNGFFRGSTKGVIENNTHLQATTLGVYAKINTVTGTTGATTIGINYDAANEGFLINNDALTYSGTTWACATTYYWPKTKHNTDNTDPTVNFYAYGPNDIGTVTNTDGVISIAVSATGTNAAAKDLIYDSELNQTYDYNDGVAKAAADKGYVNFAMTHQLSWISFEAKKTTPFTSLSITSIVVTVNESTGTFKINTTDATVGTLAAYSAAFTSATTAVPQTYSFTPSTIAISDTYQRVADFIAIPQDLSNGATTATATITYTATINGVTYADRIAVLELDGGNLTEDCCANSPWTVVSWAAGNKYTYHINFEWEEIKFAATVSSWATAGNYYRIY